MATKRETELRISVNISNRKNGSDIPAQSRSAGSVARNLSAFGVAAILLSGCVGGPGSYFETIGRDNRQTRAVDENTQLADLSVGEVENNDLTPLSPSPQPALQPAEPGQGQPAPQTGLPQPVIASANATEQASPGPVPLQLGINQTDQGELLTVPSQSPSGVNAGGVSPLDQPSETIVAYADPSTQQALPGVNEQLMASTNPAQTNEGQLDENGFAIGTRSIPVVDPAEYAAEQRIPILFAQIEHGQCSSGFGPKPKKLNATNITPGDPYYIEIRMRKTPLLPVGHTYVAYGRLGVDGELLDEKLIMLAPYGGYAGAALASGIPMPGVLTPHKDDCRIRPEASYRVSLNAQRYEKLLQEVQKAKQQVPSYLLFANNCNHFMTRIAQSVGLKPPKNIYVPALEYIYAMIENNEGRRVSRR